MCDDVRKYVMHSVKLSTDQLLRHQTCFDASLWRDFFFQTQTPKTDYCSFCIIKNWFSIFLGVPTAPKEFRDQKRVVYRYWLSWASAFACTATQWLIKYKIDLFCWESRNKEKYLLLNITQPTIHLCTLYLHVKISTWWDYVIHSLSFV